MKQGNNPIPGGWCSDPSIVRVGEDYYIAASTFEWMPGVALFHSRDLIHWERRRAVLSGVYNRLQQRPSLQGHPQFPDHRLEYLRPLEQADTAAQNRL